MSEDAEPNRDCQLCERLTTYRRDLQNAEPGWFNGAVSSFGDPAARLLIVGLAPGVKGANRTGRPFTGDYAGDLLYETLATFGFSAGAYGADPADGLRLVDAMITNAVRCVPPQNKPTGDEISRCRPFLAARIAALPKLRVVITLGQIAHTSTVRALGGKAKEHPFGHGAKSHLAGFSVIASYHCSRYNTNTGRLTLAMFEAVFQAARRILHGT